MLLHAEVHHEDKGGDQLFALLEKFIIVRPVERRSPIKHNEGKGSV
jgi:hypothetical protein